MRVEAADDRAVSELLLPLGGTGRGAKEMP
jgi:hypothetical protein